jgi:hypothetical protein
MFIILYCRIIYKIYLIEKRNVYTNFINFFTLLNKIYFNKLIDMYFLIEEIIKKPNDFFFIILNQKYLIIFIKQFL